MIKLKELLNLNELTYNDGPSEKHQRRMNYPITMFNEITIEEVPFPENTGKETLDELKYLASLEMNSDFAKENDLLKILNPIINSDSIWKSHSLYLLGEYFLSKNEKKKAKEFFEKILIVENANSKIKLEAKKRIERDLGE